MAVAIIGSYRKQGVVDSVISEMISILEERGVECQAVYLSDCNIEFCTNCRSCLQSPGTERGQCIHRDEMESILSLIDHADYLIIGSPTNAGNATALTRRFLERCVCFSYWPWGTPSPALRNRERDKRSILVSASAAPALIGRHFNGTLKALRTLSELLGAKPVGDIWVGGITTKTIIISDKIKTRIRRLVERLIKK